MIFDEEEKIRNNGYHAFWNDESQDDNPYDENTEEHDWWNIGFLEGFNSQYEDLPF